MRLFIGIPFSEKTCCIIWQKVMAINPQIAKGRMSAFGGYHLTLKFLGETSGEAVNPLIHLIEETRFSTHPFSLEFAELGSYSKRGGDVLWLGLLPSPELIALQKQVELLSVKAGFMEDLRVYSPHLTLGRGVRYASGFEAMAREWPRGLLCDEVDRFALFQSTQVQGKLSYVPLLTKML